VYGFRKIGIKMLINNNIFSIGLGEPERDVSGKRDTYRQSAKQQLDCLVDGTKRISQPVVPDEQPLSSNLFKATLVNPWLFASVLCEALNPNILSNSAPSPSGSYYIYMGKSVASGFFAKQLRKEVGNYSESKFIENWAGNPLLAGNDYACERIANANMAIDRQLDALVPSFLATSAALGSVLISAAGLAGVSFPGNRSAVWIENTVKEQLVSLMCSQLMMRLNTMVGGKKNDAESIRDHLNARLGSVLGDGNHADIATWMSDMQVIKASIAKYNLFRDYGPLIQMMATQLGRDLWSHQVGYSSYGENNFGAKKHQLFDLPQLLISVTLMGALICRIFDAWKNGQETREILTQIKKVELSLEKVHEKSFLEMINLSSLYIKKEGQVFEVNQIREAMSGRRTGMISLSGVNGSGKTSLMKLLRAETDSPTLFLHARSSRNETGEFVGNLSAGQYITRRLKQISVSCEERFHIVFLDEWDANLDSLSKKEAHDIVDRVQIKNLVIETRHQ
jgi:hypothetical protein